MACCPRAAGAMAERTGPGSLSNGWPGAREGDSTAAADAPAASSGEGWRFCWPRRRGRARAPRACSCSRVLAGAGARGLYLRAPPPEYMSTSAAARACARPERVCIQGMTGAAVSSRRQKENLKTAPC